MARIALPGLVTAAPKLMSVVLRLLSWTWRIRMVNAERLYERWDQGEQALVTCWHNRVVAMPVFVRNRNVSLMVSTSRDGEIATRALADWGIHTVRGSTTRGGARGLLQLIRAYRDGRSLALIPDGPRGPAHVAKPGIVHLARATGAPLIPVSYAADRYKQLRTWDRLLVPLPFARITFVVGEPLQVPRECTDEQIEAYRVSVEQGLNVVTAEAERMAQM